MRTAVLSDIHGNLPALEAVLADVARHGCGRIVNLGDILSGPLFPAETATRLMALELPTIRGNHERQLLDDPPERIGASDAYARQCLDAAQLAWVRGLPVALTLDAGDVRLCHGTPDSDLHYFLEDVDARGMRPAPIDEVATRAGDVAASLILCGHTHTARSVRLDDGRLIVNPGSVGLPAYVTDWPRPHVSEAGTPHARYAIVERGAHGWSVQQIALAYDWERAAQAAERHAQPEWAYALRHGRMPPHSLEAA